MAGRHWETLIGYNPIGAAGTPKPRQPSPNRVASGMHVSLPISGLGYNSEIIVRINFGLDHPSKSDEADIR